MAYVKPQVLVFQEFTIVPAEITEPLRAHISGPHAVLHRYRDSDEKPFTKVGAYNRLADTCYAYPQRVAGSRVDMQYVKLFADNALLKYYEDTIAETATETRAVKNRINWIESVTANGSVGTRFKTNGGITRSDVFGDRDVQLGDVVYLRSVSTDGDCTEKELWTYVAGFASETVASEIEAATADAANGATNATLSVTSPTSGNNYLQVGGISNCVRLSAVNASLYDGVEDGAISETYTIEVVKSTVSGCDAARLRVKSASKLDDVAELNPGVLTSGNLVVPIGSRGLTVTFTRTSASSASSTSSSTNCATAATAAGVDPNNFVVGQKWQVTVTQAFNAVVAISNNANSSSPGTYTGEKNDTYIIECTKGGYIQSGGDNFPEVTVRTAKGLDYSGPTEITTSSTSAFFPVGSSGVAVAFVRASGSGYAAVTKMRKGDKWYVKVVSSSAGAVNKLILRHDLPTEMQAVETTPGNWTYPSLDIRLFIKDDIQISRNRVGYAPLKNFYTEETQVCVLEGIVAYHPEWTDGGVEQPLELYAGDLYVEYREWVSELADEVNAISSVSELGNIRGQLDPDNPLKWGVYKALSNSNGTLVKYTAVADPFNYDKDTGENVGVNLDEWVKVLDRLRGRDDIYNLVPMTFDKQVQDLFAAHISDESNEVANNWKGGFFAIPSRPTVMKVGEGAPVAGVSGAVIADPVLAIVEDDPNATNTQYTRLRVTEGSGYFITNEVQPGDIVRYAYNVDGFGETQYSEYVVDEVLSEDSLLLYTGLDAAVTTPQRVEIWHNLNRNELADDIATRAGSFGNRRVCAVWPDRVGSGGVMQDGYYLAAALAGLASGVVPHQGLTNVEVSGFDDYTRSYKMFNETQLNRMAEAGVWIVTEDRDGTPYTRHALTTNNLDLNRKEEMIRRNVDSISYLFLRRLRPYIGRTNVTPGMVDYLKNRVNEVIRYLENSGTTPQLGSQLISGSIRVLQVHPLLKDRIEVVLDLVVPAPLNNIELHLVV